MRLLLYSKISIVEFLIPNIVDNIIYNIRIFFFITKNLKQSMTFPETHYTMKTIKERIQMLKFRKWNIIRLWLSFYFRMKWCVHKYICINVKIHLEQISLNCLGGVVKKKDLNRSKRFYSGNSWGDFSDDIGRAFVYKSHIFIGRT